MFLGIISGILDIIPVSGWREVHYSDRKNEANGKLRRYSRNGLDVIPHLLLLPTGHAILLIRFFSKISHSHRWPGLLH